MLQDLFVGGLRSLLAITTEATATTVTTTATTTTESSAATLRAFTALFAITLFTVELLDLRGGQEFGVVSEGVVEQLVLSPQIGGQERVSGSDGSEGSLGEVTEGLG